MIKHDVFIPDYNELRELPRELRTFIHKRLEEREKFFCGHISSISSVFSFLVLELLSRG
jgi:hypothetical protein